MIRRLCICAALYAASSGCGARPIGRSPFSGSGASELRGVLAVAYLSSDLRANWIPEQWREAIPEGVELSFCWLDSKAYGGEQAFLFFGRDPEEVVQSLLRAGLLMATDRVDAYQFVAEPFIRDLPTELFGNFTRRSGPAGSTEKRASQLQRYDRGDRLVLVPTVDLREWMFDLGAAAGTGPSNGPGVGRTLRGPVDPGGA